MIMYYILSTFWRSPPLNNLKLQCSNAEGCLVKEIL